jgi:hypothetical protein
MAMQDKLLEIITCLELDSFQELTLTNRNLWLKISVISLYRNSVCPNRSCDASLRVYAPGSQVEALSAKVLRIFHHSIWPFCIVGADCSDSRRTKLTGIQKLRKHNRELRISHPEKKRRGTRVFG